MNFQSLIVFILFILISGSSWSQDHDHIPTNYHVCYKGGLPKSSSITATAVKEELNLLTDMKFKFTDLDEPQKGEDDNFYIFEDDEGNTLISTNLSCPNCEADVLVYLPVNYNEENEAA